MSSLDAGTGLRGYARVLTHGPAIRPFSAAVIGRLPVGMTGLGMVLLIQQVRGTYSVAGIVTGAFALATSVGAPWWGRLMDRHGQPRILLPTALVSGLAVASLALTAIGGAGNPVLIGLAIVAGLFFPPLSPAMRAAWRTIFSQDSSRRLGYALDASAVEMIFVVGPLLLSLLAATSPPQVPLLTAAGLLVIGTVLYCLTSAARETGREVVRLTVDLATANESDELAPATVGPVTGEAKASRTALTAPGVAGVLLVSLCMAIGFGQMDTSIVATAEAVLGSTKQLGLLFLFLAGGSAIGGIVYGSREWPGREGPRLAILLGAFALFLVPWPILLQFPNPPKPLLFSLLFLTGLTVAPSLIIFQNLLDKLSPKHQMMEAQSLLSASQTTGAAMGMAIAGFTVDAFAAPGGIAGAALIIGAGAVVAFVLERRWGH